MLVKELFGETLNSKLMQDSIDEAEEEDETLSLCDLPLYSNSGEDYSRNSTSISSSDQDLFEFSSGELINPSSHVFMQENIIFCGKVIPFKQPVPEQDPNKNKSYKKEGIWGLFRRKSGWLYSKRSTKRTFPSNNDACKNKNEDKFQYSLPTKFLALPNSTKKLHKQNGDQSAKRYDFPVHKMPILTSSSSGKNRWYMLMFGLTSFSGEMELNDLKMRQSRRRSSSFVFDGEDDYKVGVETSKERGLWRMLRALSCGGGGGGDCRSAAMAAALGCVPRQ